MRLRLVVLLSASVLLLLFGCSSKSNNVDPGPEQLMKLINDYRASQSPPLAPWIYDAEVTAVAKAYAQWLDAQPPDVHEFPYSENADLIGLSGRLTAAGISVSASEEVGCSSPTISNAQLFFDNYVVTSPIILRTDIDRMGIGHVVPPRGFTYNHYWVLDVVKRITTPSP